MRPILSVVLVIRVLTAFSVVSAQAQPAPQVFTLDQAIQYAVDHYPTIRAALEQVNASAAGVDSRMRRTCRDSTRPGNRTAPRRTTSSARCCRRESSPRCRVRSCPQRPARASGAARPARCFRGSRLISGCGMPAWSSAEAALTQARAGETLTRLDVQNAVALRIPRRGRGAAGGQPPRRPTSIGGTSCSSPCRHSSITSSGPAPTRRARRPNGRRRRRA